MSSLELFAACWLAGCIAAGVVELIRIRLNAPTKIKRPDHTVDLWRSRGWR